MYTLYLYRYSFGNILWL